MISKRNSNIELLRIISIIFIIACHWSVWGFDNVTFTLSNQNNFYIYFLAIFGEVGVDIFILISSYFLVNSKFKFKKLLILGGEVYFYSILFLIVFIIFLTPITPLNINEIIQSILPISHSSYWFITNYIILILFSPFLNKFIKKLDKNEYIPLIILLLVLFSIYPTFTGKSFNYNQIVGFVILYLIGSFIRLHIDIDKINYKKLFLLFSASIIIIWILMSITLQIPILNQLESFKIKSSVFRRENSIFILAASISLFLIFLKKNEFTNKYINFIAGSTVGVYLIHDNIFVRPYIWNKLFNNPLYYHSSNLVLFSIVSIFIVYIVSVGIDIIRRLTVEKIWLYIIDNKFYNIQKWTKNRFNVIKNKISPYLK